MTREDEEEVEHTHLLRSYILARPEVRQENAALLNEQLQVFRVITNYNSLLEKLLINYSTYLQQCKSSQTLAQRQHAVHFPM